MQFSKLSLRVLSLSLLIGITFQNCASYDSASNPLHTLDEDQSSNIKDCLGSVCPQDLDEVGIAINNQPPVRMANGDAFIDLSGFCNPAGFKLTKFSYSIQTSARATVVNNQQTTVICDSIGRWALSIPTAGLNLASTSYYVSVKMAVFDDQGIEQTVASGTNKKEIATAPY